MVNSLLLDFLQHNGLRTSKDGNTRDIISISFDMESKSYESSRKNLQNALDQELAKDIQDEKRINALREKIEQVDMNKDKFTKKSKEEIRDEWYRDGVSVKYLSGRKDKEISEIVHYQMLYRSPGAAKVGDCIFICDRLYEKTKNFLRMGIDLPEHNAPIVEISAYTSLVASSIIGTVQIDPKDILILRDVDRVFNTKIVSIETDSNKHCFAKKIDNYALKNTLFDGQALIDSSIFPEWGNGYILLRHHMTKMAAFESNIQLFFKDYFGEDYENAFVEDMFGNWHKAKDIKLITTDNATKWLKFDVSYDYWSQKVRENDCKFGIVKTAHQSKLGKVQRMSYQMINALSLETIGEVTKLSKDYINKLKSDDDVFLDYLEHNKNFVNDYEALVALCKQDRDFVRSDYFRSRKAEIIRGYVNKFRTGKVINEGDNLVIVGSPYAMLLHSVGESVDKDTTLLKEPVGIQCFTERFNNGEYLAEFRSPFNSKNNMGCLHNVYDERLKKYFNIGRQCIAINMIGTDFQDRNNGSDQDSDSIYVTNQTDVVEYAKYCVQNYPTIVNNIPKDKNHYDNTPKDFSYMDNNLAKSQLAIGESSNLAQLALTYTYNFEDEKFDDYVCILSTIAQIAIDSAKRSYDIDISDEIKRIKSNMDIKVNGYPKFWKDIRYDFRKKNHHKVNYELECPMNYLSEIKHTKYTPEESTLSLNHFFQKFELEQTRRKSKRVEKMIEDFSLDVYKTQSGCNEDYLLLRNDFEELIDRIRQTYISKEYKGLMSWLIDRAFNITPKVQSQEAITNLKHNRTILFKTLYEINPRNFLEIFAKNVQKADTKKF